MAPATGAQEVVTFTAAPSQASAGVVTYTAALTGGFDLAAIDWSGFASPIDFNTRGEELYVHISWDGGPETADFALGTGVDLFSNTWFAGTTYAFESVSDPAGVWTFDFYETNDDGLDGLSDAQWDSLDVTFSDQSLGSRAVDLGVAGVEGDLITIDTFNSFFDTEIGLFDSAGVLLAANDDAGSGLQSEIAMNLVAGTYYVAVSHYDTIFADGFTVSTAPEDVDVDLDLQVQGSLAALSFTQLYSGFDVVWASFSVVPEPASLVLLGLGGLMLLGRRRA